MIPERARARERRAPIGGASIMLSRNPAAHPTIGRQLREKKKLMVLMGLRLLHRHRPLSSQFMVPSSLTLRDQCTSPQPHACALLTRRDTTHVSRPVESSRVSPIVPTVLMDADCVVPINLRGHPQLQLYRGVGHYPRRPLRTKSPLRAFHRAE
ncbi:hypothetical protein BC826DRAFT_1135311 [Russula brevipes]|nr:hypothetical protein BC826DRAFT_1135311 [Russula brevipes]